MAIRVECSTPGLEENWVEVSDVWTRGELRDYTAKKGDEFVALWRAKVTACNFVTAKGEAITDPLLVHDRLDDLDLRLLGFITTAPLEATSYLLALGEVNKRLSSAGTVTAATTTKRAPAKKRPA
jgi:hypothetical protein